MGILATLFKSPFPEMMILLSFRDRRSFNVMDLLAISHFFEADFFNSSIMIVNHPEDPVVLSTHTDKFFVPHFMYGKSVLIKAGRNRLDTACSLIIWRFILFADSFVTFSICSTAGMTSFVSGDLSTFGIANSKSTKLKGNWTFFLLTGTESIMCHFVVSKEFYTVVQRQNPVTGCYAAVRKPERGVLKVNFVWTHSVVLIVVCSRKNAIKHAFRSLLVCH